MILDSIKPLTKGQEELLNALRNEEVKIVGVFGPTGSGKSLFSLAYGIDAVSSGKYRKLIVSKPIVDIVTQEEITPKDFSTYRDLIVTYIKDVLGGFAEEKVIDDLFSSGKIEILDSRYMRGRSFNNSLIFVDDIQLMRAESVLEIFIRMGKDSRLIVAGDPVFQSLRNIRDDPSSLIREILINEKDAKVVDLGVKDIIREGAKRGLQIFLEYKLRTRQLSESEKKILDVSRIYSPDADIITIVDFSEEKKKLNISVENFPDALIIVKEGSIGRLVGKKGERIANIEKDSGKKLRGIELNLNFKEIIRAVHPVTWIAKHIEDVDFQGNELVVRLKKESGAFMGQKGSHVRLVDYVIRQLFGIGVKVILPQETEEKNKDAKAEAKKS